MMAKVYLVLATIAIARSQPMHTVVRRHDAKSYTDTLDKSWQNNPFFNPRVSFDPAKVCFNPHFDDYMVNDLLHTSPIPRPNSYRAYRALSTHDFDPLDSKLNCPRESSFRYDRRFSPSSQSWGGNGFVPLIYFPSVVSQNGRIDRKAVKYLKKLKDDLNSNPLLHQSPSKGVNVQIKGLCMGAEKSADEKNRTKRQTKVQHQATRVKREEENQKYYPVPEIMYGEAFRASFDID